MTDTTGLDRYLQFIKTCTSPAPDEYGEKHHILPCSIFPEYEKESLNIKRLFARDHFRAHYLLYVAIPDNIKIMLALVYFFRRNLNFKFISEEDIMTKYAEEYEIIKLKYNEYNRNRKHTLVSRQKMSVSHLGNSNCLGKVYSKEVRDRMSESKKGDKNHRYGKTWSDEVRKKISDGNKGHVHSEEHKKKISESVKKNPPFKGRNHSEEAKKKISEARKGKGHPHSEESKKKISEAWKNRRSK